MAYHLKIALCDIEPPIWRRLRVPGSITFAQLHSVIQAAFGWLDYHLYQFQGNGIFVNDERLDINVEMLGEGAQCLNPGDTGIKSFFENHDRCLYRYDFGDGWKHEIVVEKRLKDTKTNSVPVCLDGARHRPPEDVGGVPGYEDFLSIILDPKDPERQEMLTWAEKDTGGRIFDPEYFHADGVNRKLEYVLKDTPEAAQLLFTSGGGLTGTLRPGWYGPFIKAGGEIYSWERLGVLLSMLDGDVPVTIKVGRRGGGRR